MSILDRLLSVFGMGTDDERGDREATVTVEHAPDASDEAAVKGVDANAGVARTATETAGEGGEGDGEGNGGSRPEPEDPGGSGNAGDGDGGTDAAEGEADTPGAAVDPAETVKGIGPAYAERLEAAGVETVEDLGAADAADLAERTSLSEKRLSRWIKRARARQD